MDENRPVSNRTRLLFAMVGVVTCLAGALCAELVLGRMKAGTLLRRYHVASLLFLTDPATIRTAIPVPPPPPDDIDLQRRLDKAGGQSGDVQISLAWNNNNDLDLSCLDPNGEMIDGYNQSSRSGGVLDVDMNVTPGELLSPEANVKIRMRETRASLNHRTSMSSQPVENLVWAHNAPVGHYKVFVHQFCNKERTAQTPFWVVIRVHNQVHRIAGSVGREDFAEQLVDPKLVYEFDVAPEKPAVATSAVAPAANPAPPPPPPRIVTHTTYSLSHLEFALLSAGLWGALVGLLPMALLVAQRLYLRQRALHSAEDLVVLVGGLATGFSAALLGQLALALLAFAAAPGLPEGSPKGALPALFILVWTLLGGLFGSVLSLYTPNVPRVGGLIAGALSAFAGSSLFLLLAAVNQDVAGRLLCATLMGAAIGALIALPEQEREPQLVPETPRATYEVQPPFVVRGTRTRKVGGLRQTGPPK